MKVNPSLIHSLDFSHHHHHVRDYGLFLEFYDCNVDDDDDLGVSLVYKDTKRNMDFVISIGISFGKNRF